MRIAIFTETYHPDINGVVTSTKTTKKKLEALGHKVVIICPKTKAAPKSSDDIWRLRSIPFPFQKEYRITLPYSRKLKNFKQNFDLIHIQTPFFVGYLGQFLGWRCGLPVVHTYHTFWEEYTHYLPLLPKRYMAYVNHWFFTRNFCNRCDHVIAPTALIQEKLMSYGVTATITTVPTGVDLVAIDQVQKNAQAFLSQYQLSAEDKLITFVGRLGPEKNIEFLLKSFQKVALKSSQAKLILVGDGPQKAELKRLVQTLSLEKQVIFTGYLSHEDVIRVYLNSHLVTSASKTETQGLALLEGLAAGCPAVCLRAMGFRDLIVNEKGGILTEECPEAFAQTLLLLLNDDELYHKKQKEAKDLADTWAAMTMVQRALNIYETLVSNNKKEHQ